MTAEDPIQSLGESDWDEQDLLTIEEAGERLERELATLEERLRVSGDNADPALRERHRALAATLVNIRSGPTDVARID